MDVLPRPATAVNGEHKTTGYPKYLHLKKCLPIRLTMFICILDIFSAVGILWCGGIRD